MTDLNQNNQHCIDEDDDAYEYNLGHINFNSGHSPLCNRVIHHIHNHAALAVWVFIASLPKGWKPNQKHICRELQMGVSTYKKAIAFLKEIKLINRVQRKADCGKFLPADTSVDNGINFIHQCNNENCTRFRKKNGLNSEQNNQSAKIDPRLQVPDSVPPTVGEILNHGTRSRTVVQNPADGKMTHIDMRPLLNKTSTTTTDQVEKNNHPLKGEVSEVFSSSRLVFDLSCVKKFGIEEKHVEQLMDMGIAHLAIQESMENFAKHLAFDAFSAKIQNKPAYFMGTMRKVRYYSCPMTQEKSDAEYDKRIERQEEIRRSRELAAQQRDRDFGISPDEVALKLNEVPRSIQDVLRNHIKILDPETSLERTACV